MNQDQAITNTWALFSTRNVATWDDRQLIYYPVVLAKSDLVDKLGVVCAVKGATAGPSGNAVSLPRTLSLPNDHNGG